MAAAHTDRLEAPLATHSRPRGPAEAYPLLDPTLALEIEFRRPSKHRRIAVSRSEQKQQAFIPPNRFAADDPILSKRPHAKAGIYARPELKAVYLELNGRKP